MGHGFGLAAGLRPGAESGGACWTLHSAGFSARLDGNIDYEVWVVFRGRRTPTHSISKFDSHMAKVINFTMRTF